MLEETVTVMKATSEHVWLVGTESKACSACAQHTTCSALASFSKKSPLVLNNNLKLECGEQAILAFEERQLVKATVFLYILPLIALVLTTSLMDTVLKGDDALVALAGFSGLAMSFVLLHRLLPQHIIRPVLRAKVS
jgi:sigma-E factor negative regulatory protein RseC